METTAITMSCLIWLLLKDPEISQRVVSEVPKMFTFVVRLNESYQKQDMIVLSHIV